jgi:hypothetical protein
VPGEGGPDPGEATCGIARNWRGPPEPFLKEMVGQVLQPRLDAPVVFTGDEDERIGLANPFRKVFQRGRGLADGILLVHAVEHRQVDCLGIDQRRIGAKVVQLPDNVPSEADAQPVGTVGAIKDEDTVGHDISRR